MNWFTKSLAEFEPAPPLTPEEELKQINAECAAAEAAFENARAAERSSAFEHARSEGVVREAYTRRNASLRGRAEKLQELKLIR